MSQFFKGVLLAILGFVVAIPVCDAIDQRWAGSSISPVYEEMIGNQVFRLWKELIQKKTIKPRDPFYISGWGEEESPLAYRVVSSLKRYHKKGVQGQFRFLKNWKGHSKEASSYGVILVGAAQPEGFRKLSLKDFQNIASLFSASQQKGFLMVFANGSQTHLGLLQSIFEGAGLRVHSIISLFELEYVKDELNRQAINLDFPEYRNQIFERLVRQGMNPVSAHPLVDESIQSFRKAKEPKILIVGKN